MRQSARTAGVLAAGFTMVVGMPASLQAAETRVTQLSQYGITWTFDQPVPAGQFVNGDWWVVGPVTVTGVTPAPGPAPANQRIDTPKNQWGDTSLGNDDRMRNGSMIVLAAGGTQGYDSRSSYDPALSVTFPCMLEPNRSLISSISNPTLPVENFPSKIMWPSEKSCQCVLKTAAVLTVLPEAPPADAFRPPYAGTNKPLYRASQLKWTLLQRLTPPVVDDQAHAHAYTLRLPQDWDQMERYFQRPWLEHLMSWTQQQINPNENQPNYGREHGRLVSLASLMLQLDVPQARKQKLLVGLVQYGIDIAGVADVGGYWNEGGGHSSGRKWPVVFASLMLDAPELRAQAERTVFQEDAQTYYGTGWFGQTALYWMVQHHGPREHYEEKPPEQWSEWDQNTESYRICCNARAWVGEALAARLMGAIASWNHDAFFDYCDRWMLVSEPYGANRAPHARPADETSTFDPFVDAMWRTYRDAAPEQPMAGNPRMWVHEGGASKWVPNPKPSPADVAAHAAGIRAERERAVREQEAREREQEGRAQATYGAAVAQQVADAKAAGVPETFAALIEAENPTAQGGGAVKPARRPGAHGDAIWGWDAPGHWLEYAVDVPQNGLYQIAWKCARGEGGEPGIRTLRIDGEFPCDEARAIAIPNTGGWNNWQMHRLRWPEYRDKPCLVKLRAGAHTLRVENVSGGGVNLDYLVVAAPFLDLTTATLEN
ncbi:MAG: carbohydrate-binding protein [Lentisphaerae bacterium]|nr:carbohydrate-binding protein [Lentisphaerota bacterium]